MTIWIGKINNTGHEEGPGHCGAIWEMSVPVSRLERFFVLASALAVLATGLFGVGVYHALHDTPTAVSLVPGQAATPAGPGGTLATPGAGGTEQSSASPGTPGGPVTSHVGGRANGAAGAGSAAAVAPNVCPFADGQMRVGSIVSLNGFFQFPQAANAAKAYFQDANAHGGVHGCHISDEVLDDGTDPSTALADGKRLVADDHVLGIVSMVSPFGQDSVDPYFAAPGSDNAGQAVPVVGLDPYEEGAFTRPNQVSVDVDIHDAGALMAQYADTHMRSSFSHPGIFGYNVSQVTAAEEGTVGQFHKDGFQNVDEQTVDPSASNYDQIVQRFQSDGVDLLMWFCDLGCGERFVASAQKLGYHPHWVNYAIGYDPAYAADFGASGEEEDGAPVISPFLPYEAQTAATTRMYDTVEHYFPGTARDYITEQAWLGAQLFVTEVNRLPLSANIQADQRMLIDAVNAESALDLGLTLPLDMRIGNDPRYSAGRTPHRCAQFLSISAGKLVWSDHTWHCPSP